MYSAYYDRKTEKNEAVVLVHALQKTFFVALASMPAGSTPGDWLLIKIHQGHIQHIEKDPQKTSDMQAEVTNRLARLRSNQRSRFKK